MGVPQETGSGVNALVPRPLFSSCLVLLAAAAGAWAPLEARAQETHALVVVGIGGQAEYRERFHEWGGRIRAALVERHGVREERVVYLAERPQTDPTSIRGPSTKANVETALREMAAAAAPEDRLLIVLIGHGTASGQEALFNLPGPDLSAQEIDGLLGLFPTQQIAVVNTTSSSGPFVETLSGMRRVVVAATRTAQERNQTWFGQFFADALAGDGTDLDKDGVVSLLEAFEFTRQEVERHYQDENLLLTEHAILDDDGDGRGSAELSETGGRRPPGTDVPRRLSRTCRRQGRRSRGRRPRAACVARREGGAPGEDRGTPATAGEHESGDIRPGAGSIVGGARSPDPPHPGAGPGMKTSLRFARSAGAAVALIAALASCVRGQDASGAREAWRSGDYDRAASAYQAWTEDPDAPTQAYRERARLLSELGRYEEAARALAEGQGAELATVLGEVHLLRGRHEEAEAAFRRAVEGRASDSNIARLQIALLRHRSGNQEEAFRVFDSFIDLYNLARASLSGEELMAVGEAVQHLAVRDPALFQDALLAYDDAAARAPDDPRPDDPGRRALPR